MDRVVVIGNSAAGKSTAARELGEILGIEVIHLDQVLWKPGCRLVEPHEEAQAIEELVARPRWILDGNYTASLQMRLEAADTVLAVDFPRWRCLWRALKRVARFRGRNRPDMGGGCAERLNFQFLRWIWNYPHTERIELLRQLREHAGHAGIIFLHNPSEVDRFLQQARNEAKHANGTN